MIVSRTGYTGELGFELYFRGNEEDARKVWNAIFAQGEEYEIEPVGLGARDTLRLEKGFNLYGNDIDHTRNTIQARMGWATKVDKDSDFNGKEAILKVKQEKPKELLRGFIINADRFVPRKGYRIMKDGKEIGVVTSGNMSPTLGKPIAMGYVSRDYKDFGLEVEIVAKGNRKAPAEIVKPPFVK
jgi:aminomethyltransferase